MIDLLLILEIADIAGIGQLLLVCGIQLAAVDRIRAGLAQGARRHVDDLALLGGATHRYDVVLPTIAAVVAEGHGVGAGGRRIHAHGRIIGTGGTAGSRCDIVAVTVLGDRRTESQGLGEGRHQADTTLDGACIRRAPPRHGYCKGAGYGHE